MHLLGTCSLLHFSCFMQFFAAAVLDGRLPVAASSQSTPSALSPPLLASCGVSE